MKTCPICSNLNTNTEKKCSCGYIFNDIKECPKCGRGNYLNVEYCLCGYGFFDNASINIEKINSRIEEINEKMQKTIKLIEISEKLNSCVELINKQRKILEYLQIFFYRYNLIKLEYLLQVTLREGVLKAATSQDGFEFYENTKNELKTIIEKYGKVLNHETVQDIKTKYVEKLVGITKKVIEERTAKLLSSLSPAEDVELNIDIIEENNVDYKDLNYIDIIEEDIVVYKDLNYEYDRFIAEIGLIT